MRRLPTKDNIEQGGKTMAYMFGRVTVEDYPTFCDAFDGAEKMRHSAGSTGDTVYQSADDHGTAGQRAHLARVGFEDGLAEADLAVAGHDDILALADREDRRSMP